MGRKAIEIFLKERLCKVLTEIKELNSAKIDRDINLILETDDYDEIFNNKPKEIEKELAMKIRELNVLIICAKKGFDYYFNEELPKNKEFMSPEEYAEMEANFKNILDLKNIDLDDEEVAN
jgi:hypothetical protein